MSNLKKALFVLLYDQSDSGELEVDSSDEAYVDYIVNALIEKNGSACPFKNYFCTERCNASHEGCEEGLKIDCSRERVDIWKDFIGLETDDNDSK